METDTYAQVWQIVSALLIGLIPDTILDPNPYAPFRQPIIENNNGIPTYTDFSKIN